MFEVKHRCSGVVRTVYGLNGQYFLVWLEENATWAYVPMDEYEPMEV